MIKWIDKVYSIILPAGTRLFFSSGKKAQWLPGMKVLISLNSQVGGISQIVNPLEGKIYSC